jgi:ATP/maltotriose-dependent transcriptional regulator MalT
VLLNRIVTRFVLVGVDIPLPLPELMAGIEETLELIRRWGWGDVDSRLPAARARLAFYRGDRDEAVRQAQLAMDRNWQDPSSYASHTYLALMTKVATCFDRMDLLEQALTRVERFRNEAFRTSSRIVANTALAEMAAHQGDVQEALRLSRVAGEGALSSREHTARYLGLAFRCRLLIRLGFLNEAREVLPPLLSHRHLGVGHDAFETYLLLGMYHLAVASMRRPGDPERDRQLTRGAHGSGLGHEAGAAHRHLAGMRGEDRAGQGRPGRCRGTGRREGSGR